MSEGNTPTTPKAARRGRGRPKGSSQILQMARIADALEALVRMYQLDLSTRGIEAEPPNMGEGEVIDTDDAKVTDYIRLRQQRTGRVTPGLYVGDEPDSFKYPPATERVTVTPSLFGPNWGFNVGPEGAEEDWSGPGSNRGAGETNSGYVPRPGSSTQPEG